MKFRFFVGRWQASLVEELTIVFFDSDCLLCQGSLKWLNRLDSHDRLRFAAFDGETAKRFGISIDDDSMGILIKGEIYRASEAARLALKEAGGVGVVLAGLLKVIPFGVREWGYAWVARNRKCWVTNEGCGIPEEGMREKLMD